MKTIEIRGTVRTGLGKKNSKQTRKEGNVPCVIYGMDQNIHFHAHENSFKNLVYTPNAYIVNLDLDGSKHELIMQDIQFHPVTDRIIHIDFLEIDENKPIVISLPIKVVGDSIGVKAGGKLRIKKRSLKVRGLASNIPDFLPIDITNLKIHQSIKIGDLSYEKIELTEPKITTVLTVATSRVIQKSEGEGEPAAAAAEPSEPAAAE